MKNFQKVYHGKMEYQKGKSKWNKRSLQYNGQKASEIMADNKLHILNTQRTPPRINFEVIMRHLIFRHQGYKYKVLDDRRYIIT